jgi:hypothetical protein
MCLNETNSEVSIGKNMSNMFPTQNGLKQEIFITITFQLCFKIRH